MLEIGRQQALTVVKKTEFGVYLAESAGSDDKVLLPVKQVPQGTKEGDILTVFLYRDSEDRPIATTRTPLLTLGETALMKVRQVGSIGAFLDWGLEKDLFLPFKEQTRKVQEGETVLAALYLDKSGRLAATMKLYSYLKINSPYVIGDTVTGIIYEDHPKYGLFTAIEGRYSGLIPKKDAQGHFEVGETVTGRVTAVREDGRIEISTKKKAYLQMADDAQKILELLQDSGGELPFDDHAAPELINQETGLSKAAFKRAVGQLLKNNLVNIEDGRIRLREEKEKRKPIKRNKSGKKEITGKPAEKTGKSAGKPDAKAGKLEKSKEKPAEKKPRPKKPRNPEDILKPGKKLITTPRKRYPKPEEKITLEEFYEKEGM